MRLYNFKSIAFNVDQFDSKENALQQRSKNEKSICRNGNGAEFGFLVMCRVVHIFTSLEKKLNEFI